MKINWGTAIIMAFVLFMTFILYFVFKVQSDSKYDNELVIEEYYKHDAHFGDEMQRIQNAYDLNKKPQIIYTLKEIKIIFSNYFSPKKIKGNVSFYRPSNKKLDFEIPITSPTLRVSRDKLLDGRWNINIEWQYEGKSYFITESVYIN